MSVYIHHTGCIAAATYYVPVCHSEWLYGGSNHRHSHYSSISSSAAASSATAAHSDKCSGPSSYIILSSLRTYRCMQILSKRPRGRFVDETAVADKLIHDGWRRRPTYIIIIITKPSMVTVKHQCFCFIQIIIIIFLIYSFTRSICNTAALQLHNIINSIKRTKILRVKFLRHIEWISIALTTERRQ